MKMLAKNQKVLLTKVGPMTPSRKLCRLSTIHSQKFCRPFGCFFMCRVATWAKMIKATATIQVPIIEFEIGNPKSRARSDAP